MQCGLTWRPLASAANVQVLQISLTDLFGGAVWRFSGGHGRFFQVGQLVNE